MDNQIQIDEITIDLENQIISSQFINYNSEDAQGVDYGIMPSVTTFYEEPKPIERVIGRIKL